MFANPGLRAWTLPMNDNSLKFLHIGEGSERRAIHIHYPVSGLTQYSVAGNWREIADSRMLQKRQCIVTDGPGLGRRNVEGQCSSLLHQQ